MLRQNSAITDISLEYSIFIINKEIFKWMGVHFPCSMKPFLFITKIFKLRWNNYGKWGESEGDFQSKILDLGGS